MSRETRRGFLGKLLAAPVVVAAAREATPAPAAPAPPPAPVRYEPTPRKDWIVGDEVTVDWRAVEVSSGWEPARPYPEHQPCHRGLHS